MTFSRTEIGQNSPPLAACNSPLHHHRLIRRHLIRIESRVEHTGDAVAVHLLAAEADRCLEFRQRWLRQQITHEELGRRPQQPVWLARCVAPDSAARRVGRVARDACQPQRHAVDDIGVEKTHQDHWVLVGGGVDIPACGQASRRCGVGEVPFVPTLADNPMSRRRDGGAGAHQFHHLLWRAAFVQTDAGEFDADL
jgi:hypothetical protein